jgi:hypothetical protein
MAIHCLISVIGPIEADLLIAFHAHYRALVRQPPFASWPGNTLG